MYILNWLVGKDVHGENDLVNKKEINVWAFGPFEDREQAERFQKVSNINSGYKIQELCKPMIPNSKEFPI